MTSATATPRVNFEMLSQHIGQVVRLVGKVESVEGTDLKLRAADEGIVTVHLRDAAPSQAFVEFDAKVDSPTEVSAITCTSFGDSFGAQRATRTRGVTMAMIARGEPGRARWASSRARAPSSSPLSPLFRCVRRSPRSPRFLLSSASPDLENYNEVCRLMNGEYKNLFA